MKIQIQGIEELPSKSNELVKSVSKLLNRVDPDLSDSLLKALPKKDELFTDPVQLEILKQWELGYRKQVDLMIADIEKVINRSTQTKKGFVRIPILNKSLDYDSKKEWIGVDLDGTLAEYTEFKGAENIGKPIPKMVDRVKQWVKAGKRVKIMTARADTDNQNDIAVIEKWCVDNIGVKLPVTCKKDKYMIELWDDRVVRVKKNTGDRE